MFSKPLLFDITIGVSHATSSVAASAGSCLAKAMAAVKEKLEGMLETMITGSAEKLCGHIDACAEKCGERCKVTACSCVRNIALVKTKF